MRVCQLSIHCVGISGENISVHDLRQRCHVYGFIESLVRLAATKYCAGSAQGAKTLCDQLQKLCTDNLLPYSCAHDNVSKSVWFACRPSCQVLHRAYRAQVRESCVRSVRSCTVWC